ncbi:hypothetical protein [Nocardia salmonicida]|uniref:hypothetical protein n=1 Tax=Nocardia salmonicida TaxID=53431 RepID=UPI0007C66DE2|nr:hypothetical protein [Nocardia salmonicida]
MTGNEKPRIGDPEKPNTWSHWTIFDSFNPLDTTEADNAKSEYTKLASDWSAAVETFAARIRRSSTSAWEGVAATASQNAIADYATRALELTPALNALAQRVTTTVNGVNDTRNSVDKPETSTSNPFNLDSWFGGKRSLSSINDARDDAREAMQAHYVDNFVAAEKEIPVLPQPENPTSPLTTWKPAGGDSSKNGEDGEGNGGGTNPADANSEKLSEETPSTTEEPATTETPTDTDDSSDDDTTDDSTDDTGPSTTEEQGSTTPATTPSGLTPSGSSGTGSPGAGSPGGGSPGGSSPGGSGVPSGGTPGAVTPGSPTATARVPTGASAGAAGSGTGRAGAPGMGGMGSGRGGGKSEEDESHQIPDWLKNMENTEELLGEMPRVVQGGVIGGDVDE